MVISMEAFIPNVIFSVHRRTVLTAAEDDGIYVMLSSIF